MTRLREESYTEFAFAELAAVPHDGRCVWCPAPVEPDRRYCSTACMKAHRAWKLARGAVLVDPLMDWAAHRHAAKGTPEAALASKARRLVFRRLRDMREELKRRREA